MTALGPEGRPPPVLLDARPRRVPVADKPLASLAVAAAAAAAELELAVALLLLLPPGEDFGATAPPNSLALLRSSALAAADVPGLDAGAWLTARDTPGAALICSVGRMRAMGKER